MMGGENWARRSVSCKSVGDTLRMVGGENMFVLFGVPHLVGDTLRMWWGGARTKPMLLPVFSLLE